MDKLKSYILKNAIDNIAEAVYIIADNAQIVYANTYASEYIGYSNEELLQMSIAQINPNYSKTDSIKNLWETIAKNNLKKFKTQHKHKDGHLIDVEVVITLSTYENNLYATAIVKNIAEVIQREKESELYSMLLNHSNDMVFIVSIHDGSVHYINEQVTLQLGYSLDELNTIGIEHIRKPIANNSSFMEHLQLLKDKGSLVDYAILKKKDESEFLIEANVKFVRHNGMDYNVAIVRDISMRASYEQKIATLNNQLQVLLDEKSHQLDHNISMLNGYKLAMDATSIVSITDSKGKITYVNEKFCEISGYSFDECIGQTHSMIRHPNTPHDVITDLWKTVSNKKIWSKIIENKNKDGSSYIADVVVIPILDKNNDIIAFISARHDLTELVKQKNELKKIANISPLTQMPNRSKLNFEIKNLKKGAIALVDINRFHEINDFYGTEVGDLLILVFGQLLQEKLKDKYDIFHLHADEFVIYNTKCPMYAFQSDMQKLHQEIYQLDIDFEFATIYFSTTMSLSFEAPEQLIKTANLAHRFAKDNKISYMVYSSTISYEKEYQENMKWAKVIKNALDNDKIHIYFQPIFDIHENRIAKYEVLVRLENEDGEIITPNSFLDVSKKSNQYLDITRRVIDKSFDYFRDTDIKFAINVTNEDIISKDFLTYIRTKLITYPQPNNITFEIVESEGIENMQIVNSFIEMIQNFGCELAIDDFGTGYSNFEYLVKLNANSIKIDGSLIKNIDTNQDHYNIVKTIVSFAKIKNLKVVAEYVSNKEIFDHLHELQIDYAQGYFVAQPSPHII